MTQSAQRAWAAALRRAALPSSTLVVNPVDLWRYADFGAVGREILGVQVARAYDRWLRRTLTATVARKIVAQATNPKTGRRRAARRSTR